MRSDGEHRPVNLKHFDPGSGIVAESAGDQLLLPPAIAAVAREAQRRQAKLVSRISEELQDPTRVIPEGIDVDGALDLSAYASRVLGFERYQGRPRPLVHDSSGIDWHLPPDDGAFLRLPFRRLG